MASLFAESNRLASVFDRDLGVPVNRELELIVPLSPQVSWGDIIDMLGDEHTALWLDHECLIVDAFPYWGPGHSNRRYIIGVDVRISGSYRKFALYQALAITEPGAPLPALEYLIDQLTNYDRLISLEIEPDFGGNSTKTLDVSPACFLNLLQTSRHSSLRNDTSRIFNSVIMYHMSLTAEHTALLFTHDTGPIFIDLEECRFHGPTLLQLGSVALPREQTHHIGGGRSDLKISLDAKEIGSASLGELTALLSNPHLRYFCPFSVGDVAYESVNKLVSALAANKISTLECLCFDAHQGKTAKIEWEKKEEPSAWINLWKAIEQHPSLKMVHLVKQRGLCQQSWWHPIAAAVKVNPQLVCVEVMNVFSINNLTWNAKLAKHVEPLLERNRYGPKIAALCRTDPSKAAVLLGHALVAIEGKKYKHVRCKREIRRMLLNQLVLTGYDFGVGVGRVLGTKRPLADTVVSNDVIATETKPAVVVSYDIFASKTEPQLADTIATSTSDNNKESKLIKKLNSATMLPDGDATDQSNFRNLVVPS